MFEFWGVITCILLLNLHDYFGTGREGGMREIE